MVETRRDLKLPDEMTVWRVGRLIVLVLHITVDLGVHLWPKRLQDDNAVMAYSVTLGRWLVSVSLVR